MERVAVGAAMGCDSVSSRGRFNMHNGSKRERRACENTWFWVASQARFPPAVTSRPLLSALTAAIECDPGLACGVKSARR